MSDAYVIETAGETAGIVVVEKRGVRFYASHAPYQSLDGKTFGSVGAVERAVGQVRRSRSMASPARQAS